MVVLKKGLFTKKLAIRRKSDNALIAAECGFTESVWERMRGLLGKNALGEAEALWIEPCNSIHTFFMRFAIDVVFLDSEKNVVAIYEAMKPWRMSALHWRAKSVLELPSGAVKKLKIRQGEVLDSCSVN